MRCFPLSSGGTATSVFKSALAAVHDESHLDEIRQSLINLGIIPINALV
jgi:hypothetical protein